MRKGDIEMKATTTGRGRRRAGRGLPSAHGERGQMLVFFALLVVPVTFVLSAVVVDASLWQSERRGAYKDADLSALAGALELARPAPDEDEADAQAFASASTNDEAGNAGQDASNVDVTVDNSCFPDDSRVDAVAVDLTHDSQTFFSSIFGMDIAPDIGAHAKACAGATQAPNGIVPFQMDIDTQPSCFEPDGAPIFGALCEIEYGAQHPNVDRGILDLEADDDYCSDATGSGDLEDLIEWGAPGTCLINSSGDCDPDKNGPWYDCVAIQAGNPSKVARAVERRIAREGACDSDGNGYESFEETVILVVDDPNPSFDVYEARDCEPAVDGDQISPRLVTIIVLEDPPDSSSNTGYPIYAFAGFYISGCDTEVGVTDEDDLDRFCDTPGGGNASLEPAGSTAQFVSYPMHHRCGHQTGQPPPATCTPVPTNTPLPSPTASPTRTPTSPGGPPPTATNTPNGGGGGGGGNGVGHIVVYGRFVNLIFSGHEAGPPTETTTLFSISLVE